MTKDKEMPELLAVTQADRELWKWILDAPYATCSRIDNLPDDAPELQKIARHRLASTPADDVVEWHPVPGEWEEITSLRSSEEPVPEVTGWEAATSFETFYQIEVELEGYVLSYDGGAGEIGTYESEVDAKRAADKDHSDRIRAALSTRPKQDDTYEYMGTSWSDNEQDSGLADELERLSKQAYPAPWCWEQCGDKCDAPVIGAAWWDDDDSCTPIAGEIDGNNPDNIDRKLYRECIAYEMPGHADGGASANACLIVWLRNHVAEILTALRSGDAELLRDMLKAAYVQGATDVHNEWSDNPLDADFGEAGDDYAAAKLNARLGEG